ncbi:PST family polysaccharide transporter [Evansella vedderi]|uniref:PST family polysaccharide transporter n=1 Tax=Evansella vedderi TaxID=38282 RepID=A0ABU0A2Z4_9BACI|nr:polysaccharide biosynthesis protein [Evansella vedderi]MDQ0257866.1 PST family polysaccharide transporter [Evansella vedderi]
MKEPGQASSQWVKGAIYLSLAALFVKALSALYKIPYQNLTGDVGYYVYQQVYPIYGVAFVLGTYGFPLVISKMLVDALRETKEKQSHLLLFLFFSIFLLNAIIGTILILFAGSIAQLMGDSELTLAIRWLGAPFFIIAFLSVGRGYFQSRGNMAPTAVSQVMEQTIRVAAILIVAIWTMRAGNNPYLAGTSAGIGSLIGGITGVIVMIYFLKRDKRFSEVIHWPSSEISINWVRQLKTLIVSSFLVSVSAMALIIFQLIDSFTVYRQLVFSGWEVEIAAALKGIYDRGWPMVQLGAVVTTVFSYGMLPYITQAFNQRNTERLQRYVTQSVKVCIVFGGAASLGLMVILPNLNPMLFTDKQGTEALQILSLTVFFGALFMTIAALFHAVGKAIIAAKILMAGLLLKILGNSIAIPFLGIEGAAISTVISFVFLAYLSYYFLKRESFIEKLGKSFWLKWAISLLGMALVVWLYQKGTMVIMQLFWLDRLYHCFVAISSALLGAMSYLLFLWKWKVFTREEWESLPKISKFFPYGSKK